MAKCYTTIITVNPNSESNITINLTQEMGKSNITVTDNPATKAKGHKCKVISQTEHNRK